MEWLAGLRFADVRWLGAGVVFLAIAAMVPQDHVTASPPAPLAPTPLTAKGPVGWDVYRRLDLLPLLPRGVETRQFSSFDRAGRNNDFSHCLQLASDGCVLAEHRGPGEIDSMWFTRDFGDVSRTGAIKIELDGVTVVFSSLQDLVSGRLGAPFVFPLVADALRSSGGNFIAVPMPFRSSMRVITDADPIYYHVTYRVFADADGVRTFDPRDRALDVVARFQAAGSADPKPVQPNATTTSRDVTLEPGGSATLADLGGPGVIDAIQLHVAAAARGLRLQLAFDGVRTVDAPLDQFFGAGLGSGRVAALMFAMDARSGTFAAWWPMPYRSRATISLVNTSPVAATAIGSRVTSAADPRWDALLGEALAAGYFRADSHAAATVPGVDYPFLEATGAGKLVAVNATLIGPGSQAHLEGNEHFRVDGSRTPQVPGTGTEDFFGGGWYFDHGTFRNPTTGEPGHERTPAPGCPANRDCTDAYRTLLADAVPFGGSIAAGIEHGPVDDIQALYASTAIWYGQDRSLLHLDDEIRLGGATVTGTYEGDDGTPVPISRSVAVTRGPVHFELTVSPANAGVVLRRTCDQQVAYQSATVIVDGRVAGVWLEPLGNPYHRWLDDTFLLPASLTAGKRLLEVTLLPSRGAPPWTAAGYQALSIAARVEPRSELRTAERPAIVGQSAAGATSPPTG